MHNLHKKYSKEAVAKILRLRSLLVHLYGEADGSRKCSNLMRRNDLKTLIFKYGKKLGTEKYEQLLAKHRRKGTLAGFIDRYGEVDGPAKYAEKNSKLSVGTESLRRRGYSDEEIAQIKSTHSKKSAATIENYEARYGKEAGRARYAEMLENKKSFRRWQDVAKYYNISERQAKQIVSNIQKRDLDFYIEKYGSELGSKKYDAANELRAYANTEAYYIEKYGTKLGKLKYQQRIKDCSKANYVEYWIDKLGDEEGRIYYADLLKRKLQFFSGSSKSELEFVKLVYDRLAPNLQELVYAGGITDAQFVINLPNDSDVKCMIPDFRLKNVIIEFDGVFWHSTEDAIKRDQLKDVWYRKLGYSILRVTDEEFKKDADGIVTRSVDFILDNVDLQWSSKKHEDYIN